MYFIVWTIYKLWKTNEHTILKLWTLIKNIIERTHKFPYNILFTFLMDRGRAPYGSGHLMILMMIAVKSKSQPRNRWGLHHCLFSKILLIGSYTCIITHFNIVYTPIGRIFAKFSRSGWFPYISTYLSTYHLIMCLSSPDRVKSPDRKNYPWLENCALLFCVWCLCSCRTCLLSTCPTSSRIMVNRFTPFYWLIHSPTYVDQRNEQHGDIKRCINRFDNTHRARQNTSSFGLYRQPSRNS